MIEDYSLGSHGKVFDIAEATGILKYILYSNNLQYKQIPPTTVKKFATFKGNAPKEKMYEFFVKDTSINLKTMLNCNSIISPLTDIVDSYYLARIGLENDSKLSMSSM